MIHGADFELIEHIARHKRWTWYEPTVPILRIIPDVGPEQPEYIGRRRRDVAKES